PAALRDRRLPEEDRLRVRGRLVQVVVRARALLQLVHERARFWVDGRLAEDERLLRLDARLRDVLHPQVRTVRMWCALREHPRVRPSRRALLRDRLADRRLRRLELERLVRPTGPDHDVAV